MNSKKWKGVAASILFPVVIYLLFFITGGERFAGVRVLRAILIQSFMPLLCAYGMVFGRSMRMLDLSIGSRIIASSMIGGIVAMNYNLGIPGFVLVTVAASVLLGAVCGLVFRYFKIPSIVVSLVIAMIFEVIGAKVTDGMGFLKLERDLAILGGIPYNIIVVIVTTVIFYCIYYKTKFCYNVINVDRTKFLAYVVGSIFIGIAAVIQMSYATSMSAKLSMESLSMSFKPLMAMIVGVQLQDYVGLPVGIFIGSFMISTLFSGLVALGFPAPAQDIALGIFLVVVVSLSTNTERIGELLEKQRMRKTA